MSQQQAAPDIPRTLPHLLDITVRTGRGIGSTSLSAFDHALQGAGIADFNLVTLSSVIPPRSRVRIVDSRLAGGHGDVLFCVMARADATHPGETAWAGLGWCTDETGGGLFVEHHGHSEAEVVEQIELSLADMNHHRGGGYGPVQMAVASAHYVDRPACALVTAAYQVSTWAVDTPASVTTPVAEVVPQPAAPGVAPGEVEVVSVISAETARELHELYRASFGELETRAAARQLVEEREFIAEVTDPRIDKYVVRDEAGAVVGLTTLTDDLSAVPWISPAYFAARFPDQAARGALHYLGFTLVRGDRRRDQVFRAMIAEVTARMIPIRGVVAWDMCRLRQEQGLRTGIDAMLKVFGDVETVVLDEQTYVASMVHGAHGHTDPPIRPVEDTAVATGGRE